MYRRVNAAEHLTTGDMPSYTLTAISKVYCVLKCMLMHCYKLSWNDHGKICKGYDNSGLVNGISQGVIFYAKGKILNCLYRHFIVEIIGWVWVAKIA